MNVILVN